MTSFGGEWTREKLDLVSKYLHAFSTALRDKFSLVYIDAFCGDGEVELRGDELPLLRQGREFTEGSAQRALSLQRPFDRYHFIDRSATSLEKLESYVESEKPHLRDRVQYHCGDVNDLLPQVTAMLSRGRERAVVFADPFGMQVDWETIEAVGSAIVDFWYLVPTMAINRVLARTGVEDERWARRLDRFLGTPTWRERWYGKSPQGQLFGETPGVEKTCDTDRIEADFHERLKTVFFMAENKVRLADRGRTLFTLMFGCSNRDPKAFGLALKIANDLLKG